MSLMKRRTAGAWPAESMERPWSQDLVDGMFGDMLRNFFAGEGVLDRTLATGSHPRIEEYVEDDTCVIRIELPGLDPEKDVEISVADGVLNVRAHRQERTEEERPDGFRSEFHYGSVERNIGLPEGASEADVVASYKDGILEVRMPAPRPTDTSPKRIPVSRP